MPCSSACVVFTWGAGPSVLLMIAQLRASSRDKLSEALCCVIRWSSPIPDLCLMWLVERHSEQLMQLEAQSVESC